MRKAIQSRSSQDQFLDVPKTIKFSQSQIDAMESRRQELGTGIAEQVRRALDKDLAGRFDSEPKIDNAVRVELNDADTAALLELSGEVVHVKNLDVFAESLMQAAIKAGPEAVKRLFYIPHQEEKPAESKPAPTPAKKEIKSDFLDRGEAQFQREKKQASAKKPRPENGNDARKVA